MSVIETFTEFLNTLTTKYELQNKCWINTVVMIPSVPHCLCWLVYFQNIITFLFEKISCAVEILILSDIVDFLTKSLEMVKYWYDVSTYFSFWHWELTLKRRFTGETLPWDTSAGWPCCVVRCPSIGRDNRWSYPLHSIGPWGQSSHFPISWTPFHCQSPEITSQNFAIFTVMNAVQIDGRALFCYVLLHRCHDIVSAWGSFRSAFWIPHTKKTRQEWQGMMCCIF